MTCYVEVPPAVYVPKQVKKAQIKIISARAERVTPRLGSLSINDTPSKPSETAWKSYRNCPVQIKQKYGKLLTDFCEYMQMCDGSGFSAQGIAMDIRCKKYSPWSTGNSKNDFGRRLVSGPLLNRWHPKRRTAWTAKMYRVAQWYENQEKQECTLVTLTGYQENSGLSWYDTLDNIGESRIKLLKILRKYLGKVSYFWVIEPHTKNDNGYPHIHLAVFKDIDNTIKDSFGEGMEDKLRRLYSEEWKTGSHTYGLDFQQMKGENQIQDLKNYLMKYISKGYITEKPWSPGELIFNAHLYGAVHGNRPSKEGEQLNIKGVYAKKYRIIGMSRDLSDLIKPEQEDKEQIVWLHTDETEPQEIKTEDGEIITEERKKVLYDRQLIPDWIDTLGSKRLEWGRPTTRYTGYDRIIKIPKKETDQEKWNREYEQRQKEKPKP